jgi:hypothetical protein
MARKSRSNVTPLASRPGKEQKPSSLRFYGDEFVFDTVSGLFYRISPTAGFLLRSLDAGAEIADLARLLQSRYRLDRATAARDVALFLNDLAALEPFIRLNL